MKQTRTIGLFCLLISILLLSSCNNEPNKPEPKKAEFDIVPYIFTAIFGGIAGAGIMAAYAENESKQQSEIELAKKAKREKRYADALDKIPTSSDEVLVGYRISRHIKFVSTTSAEEQDLAEIDFLTQVKAAGANGVIKMKITRNVLTLLIEGDAVLVEPTAPDA